MTSGLRPLITPTGVTFLGQQIDIDLHGATTTRAQPFVFTFELDASALFDPDTFEPVEPQNVGVYRSGELVPDCTVADGTVEEPNVNPCVSSRTETATGGVVIVVLTTMASPWNLSTTRRSRSAGSSLRRDRRRQRGQGRPDRSGEVLPCR